MRLLTLEAEGRVSLSEWQSPHIPPYAVLSHTWGESGEEVTYDDILKGTAIHKRGYQKIQFCGRKAASDGLLYFWVDTCCINRSDNTELSEAINSMFRWYRNAARCYVFLSDVSALSELEKSKWFTRGWTLQELIAPRTVEFFSFTGERLGDKGSLENRIHEITRIQIPALRGDPLAGFPVHERMSWAHGRQTTKKEDIAYCLLGIFDVFMPLIYGEGETNARLRLMGEIDKRLGTSQLPVKEETHFLVPFGRNEDFVGRERVLDQLLETIPPMAKLNDCQREAIEGLGGVGKTQIALEAAYRVREKYPECSIFWLPAVSHVALENAYREVGQALRIPGIDGDKAETWTLVKTALEKRTQQWLLIVDNVDDLSLLSEDSPLQRFLPFSRQGSILVTTRNHEVTIRMDIPPRNIVRMTEMSENEALQMLQNGLQELQLRDNQSTIELLQYLACLPLAIKQAAAYMARTGETTTDYLQYCLTSDEVEIELLNTDFEDRSRYTNNTNPITTTWLISFQHLAQSYPLAIQYLKYICFLGEKNIPFSLLPPGKDKRAERQAIGVLEGYAFIMVQQGTDMFDMHRLVRLATRNWVRQSWAVCHTNVIKHLADIYPFPDHHNRQVWTSYMPHAQIVLEIQDDYIDKNAKAYVLFNVAESYNLLGNYRGAERMHREALELKEEVLGQEHPSTLNSMNNLGIVFNSQGKYTNAEKIHRQTLELRQEVLGPNHPSTLNSMNNLALVLDNEGKYVEAEKMYQQTLKLTQEVLGPGHRSTLDSMNNLAMVLNSQGKYVEAEKMHRQTLQQTQELLGPNHPSTLDSMNNLAIVLDNQGKYVEAEKMHRQTLQQTQDVLGPNHPSTLDSMNNLALVLENQGIYMGAEKMHRQTLELRQEVLGPNHPSTLNSMNNLALVLKNQGKYLEAEKMHREALELKEEVLGQEHPSTLNSMNNLAVILNNQDKYVEAETMHRQTLELRQEVLGQDHPYTLDSMNNLALVLKNQGKYLEAETMHRQTLQQRQEVLGTNHPSTLDSMNNLAVILTNQEKYVEAETMHRQTLELTEEMLGPDHPSTVRSRNNLRACRKSKQDNALPEPPSGEPGLQGKGRSRIPRPVRRR